MRYRNPIAELIKMYHKRVKEKDKAGYAKTYKESTKHFFDRTNEYFDCPTGLSYFKDITFSDGYYIFGFGTNSVVHFHMNRCVGWLFGIWWEEPKEKQDDIHGTLFAQFEETIDKFKPSASANVAEFTVNIKTGEMIGSDRVMAMINFISCEPYSAFCRQYCGLGWGNEDFITEEEAKAKYEEYLLWKENEKRYIVENDEKILSFICRTILPCFTDAHVIDKGECWSPRYIVIAPYKKNTDKTNAPGTYEWADLDDKNWERIMKEYDDLVRECTDISHEHKFAWFSPVYTSITFTK